METPELPDDLAAIEAELTGRSKPTAPAMLRGRSLAAARDGVARSRRLGPWRFAASLAAAVLLALHVMLAATMNTNFTGPVPGGDPAALAREIRRVAPELPPGEAERLARLHLAR